MGLVLNGKRISPITKAGEKIKRIPVAKKVKPETEYVGHSMLGDEADMRLHMKNLQAYLKENPGDIDTRISLAFLKMMFPGN